MIDQSLKLSMIIVKYAAAKKAHVYMAFMYLSATFDCVAHSKLWFIWRIWE